MLGLRCAGLSSKNQVRVRLGHVFVCRFWLVHHVTCDLFITIPPVLLQNVLSKFDLSIIKFLTGGGTDVHEGEHPDVVEEARCAFSILVSISTEISCHARH